MALYFLAGLIGIAFGGGGVFLWASSRLATLRERLRHQEAAQGQMQNVFSHAARDALIQNNEQFLLLAQEKLKQAQTESAHDLEKRQLAIGALVQPIDKMIQEMTAKVEGLGKTGTGLESQLKTFAEDQRALRQETQKLAQAMRNTNLRGHWGEMQLQRTLEMIGMIEGTHYMQQQSVSAEGGTHRPDFILMLPGGMRIVIDVKAPMEPYWSATAQEDAADLNRPDALDNFRRKLRDHLKTLKTREYWRHFEGSPEFVVMFLPTEGLYSLAVSNDPALIEDAAHANVILASPTTLMGLLRVAMHGWQQQNIAEDAKKIAALASDVYNRLAKFGEHMQKLGVNLGRAMGAYNDATGSLERSVLSPMRKLKDMHVQTGGREIEELVMLDIHAQIITAPELLGSVDDKQSSKKRA